MSTDISPIDRFPLGFQILHLMDEARRLLAENGKEGIRHLIGACLARRPQDENEIQDLVERIAGDGHLFDLTNEVLHGSKDLWWDAGEFVLHH